MRICIPCRRTRFFIYESSTLDEFRQALEHIASVEDEDAAAAADARLLADYVLRRETDREPS